MFVSFLLPYAAAAYDLLIGEAALDHASELLDLGFVPHAFIVSGAGGSATTWRRTSALRRSGRNFLGRRFPGDYHAQKGEAVSEKQLCEGLQGGRFILGKGLFFVGGVVAGVSNKIIATAS